MKQKGFTLLELLLVVGIAAILIVAGITTYNLVTRGNKINEAIRLINILADQTRRLYVSRSSYGNSSIEAALYNAGAVPEKYKSATAGQIASPFSTTSSNTQIYGYDSVFPGTFAVQMNAPAAYIPELAAAFSPHTSGQIILVVACSGGAALGATVDIEALAMACGSSEALQTFLVIFR